MAPQQPSSARDQVRDIVPALVDLSERVLFGEVWERPGLSKRDRSLITCATLIALGREKQLVGHLQRALDNGLQTKRTERGHYPSCVLRRLAGGDDRGARRQATVRKPLAMARLGRSASAKPQTCSRTLLHLLRSPLGTYRSLSAASWMGGEL